MDLIDRQALLKQIEIDSDGEPGYYGDTWKFIDTIKNLPSATDNNVGTEHGTNLAEVGTDCISRAAAIDYFVINVGFHDEDGYPIEDTDELRKIWTEYFNGIPPAEPKRGKWIIKKSTIHPYGNDVCCSICGHTMGSTFGYKFCPMCGADMRGEQNE